MPRQKHLAALHDREWLWTQYVEQQQSQGEIAAMLGCSNAAVTKALQRFEIPARTPHETMAIQGTAARRTRNWELEDEAWLRDQYETQQRSVGEIAAQLGCSGMPVHRALVKFGIPRRKPGLIRQNTKRADATLAFSEDGRRRRRYHNEYVRIQVPEHPAADRYGYIPEHRWVAEQTLGRLLKSGEIVHHIDGDGSNNDPDNLIVFRSQAAHAAFHAREKSP